MKSATAEKKTLTGDSRKAMARDKALQADTRPQENYWRSVAILAKGISDENRLRILLCLTQSRKSVTRIVEEVGLSQPLVSHHLKELKQCLLVDIERKGPFIYYGLADLRVIDVVNTLSTLAASLVAARKSL
jgi:DNA-binding transcriptional ArsR family regulator